MVGTGQIYTLDERKCNDSDSGTMEVPLSLITSMLVGKTVQ